MAVASYAESDFLPLSGLQHLVFCERQCALIHLEQAWRENFLTAEGRVLHEKVDAREGESRGDLRVTRGVPLRSFRLGLAGRADVVELHRMALGEGGVRFPGIEGYWRAFPVEYKRGQRKWIHCDRIQLCAQAICLEEMLRAHVPTGALFYGRVRRREQVDFNGDLRRATEDASSRFHEIVASGKTPIVYRETKCRRCSLFEVCLPPKKRAHRSVDRYLASALAEVDA